MEKSRSQKTGSKANPALSEINSFGHTALESTLCEAGNKGCSASVCVTGKVWTQELVLNRLNVRSPRVGSPLPLSGFGCLMPQQPLNTQNKGFEERLRDMVQWAGRELA